MTTFMLAGIVSLLMIALLLLRVPIAFSLLIAGVVGLISMRSFDFAVTGASTRFFDSAASWSLIVVPLFVGMGVFARHGTLATDSFELAGRLLKKVPGGLAMATILAAAGFAAINGSSVATIAAIGPTSIREMRRAGYSAAFSAGVIGSAGTLGVLIPPSIFLVLYAIIAEESVGKMLIAGIIPGIVTVAVFMLSIFLRAKFAPSTMLEKVSAMSPEVRAALTSESSEPAEGHQDFATTKRAKSQAKRLAAVTNPAPVATPMEPRDYFLAVVKLVMLITVVLGGIYSGILTVVEAAAFGMLLTIAFLVLDQVTRFRVRSFKPVWRTLRDAAGETVGLNAMMFALIVGATVFALFLVLARVPQSLSASIIEANLDRTLVVILFLLVLIPMGMFLDSISILLIAVPLMHPVISELGFDGIWFGILVIKLIELGLITPPTGLNAFVASGVSGVPVFQVFKGLVWFVPLDFLLVATFFVFPQIVTWLPDLMIQ